MVEIACLTGRCDICRTLLAIPCPLCFEASLGVIEMAIGLKGSSGFKGLGVGTCLGETRFRMLDLPLPTVLCVGVSLGVKAVLRHIYELL